MFAQFEERIALTFVQLLQSKDINVKRDRCVDITNLDSDMIAALDLNAHLRDGIGAPEELGCTSPPRKEIAARAFSDQISALSDQQAQPVDQPAGSDSDRHAAATSRFDHREDNAHIQ